MTTPRTAHREDFPDGGELPWLDRPGAMAAIAAKETSGALTLEQAAKCRKWTTDGYVVLDRIFPADKVEPINDEAAAVFNANRHLPLAELKQKFENLFLEPGPTRVAVLWEPVLRWIDLLLGKRVEPYQTLNLPVSSQLGAHSDQILMTTHPQGYMIAAWFALEDVLPDAGPLALWPGSHRLRAISATEAGVPPEASEDERLRVYDELYYGQIRGILESGRFKKFLFLGKRGDVLLWHSNLLHGADQVLRPMATRKSLIVHYFADDVVTYSDVHGTFVEPRRMRS